MCRILLLKSLHHSEVRRKCVTAQICLIVVKIVSVETPVKVSISAKMFFLLVLSLGLYKGRKKACDAVDFPC